MIVQSRLAKYLRDERSEISESKLADKAGIKQPRFSMIMNLKSEMRADELMQICEALGVSPETFLQEKT